MRNTIVFKQGEVNIPDLREKFRRMVEEQLQLRLQKLNKMGNVAITNSKMAMWLSQLN